MIQTDIKQLKKGVFVLASTGNPQNFGTYEFGIIIQVKRKEGKYMVRILTDGYRKQNQSDAKVFTCHEQFQIKTYYKKDFLSYAPLQIIDEEKVKEYFLLKSFQLDQETLAMRKLMHIKENEKKGIDNYYNEFDVYKYTIQKIPMKK